MKPYFTSLIQQLAGQHPYIERERSRAPLHDAISKAIEDHGLEPASNEQLIKEWPHVSADQKRLAYTRTTEQGEADRQTVTSVGRYLTQCFPSAKSNVIRDIAALYQGAACQFTERTIDAYIDAVQNGPASCMKFESSSSVMRNDDHPYCVYDPDYGWHMAVHKIGDEIWGRCMCLEDGDDRIFVRSYYRNPNDISGYSGSDNVLEAWLKDQGYRHQCEWPSGSRLAYFENCDGQIIMPYLDGCRNHIDRRHDGLYICDSGDFQAHSTDGTIEHGETCSWCDELSGDTTGVGEDGDDRVCESCLEEHYVYAYGRRGNQYFCRYDCAIEVSGEYYDQDYLSDNDIVQIDCGGCDGEYAHDDDVTRDYHGNNWHCRDEGIVLIQHGIREGSYFPKTETWTCAHTGNFYTDDDRYFMHEEQKCSIDVQDELTQQALQLETPDANA